MNIEKTHWSSQGTRLNIAVPFAKVNKEKRTVSGFATLNNLDQTGDVVTAEASLKAFERFRGNLREMHQPIAVGKVVSFKPETFFDPESKAFYDGVWVTSYISKGAQDTWEKVLDGTLSGFSIGGRINESDNEVNKADGTTVRFIKDYDLVELSLVDSPANELCNILSIEKVNGQLVYKGLAADVVAANVFYCETDNFVVSDSSEKRICSVCSNEMKNIGWVENSEVNKADTVRYIYEQYINKVSRSAKERENIKLPDFNNQLAKQANTQINEGGSIVSEAKIEDTTSEAVVEETPAPEVETVAEQAAEDTAAMATEVAEDAKEAETVEKSADVSEVQVEEPDFAKMLGDLKGFFSDTLSKASEKSAEQVAEVKATVETFTKSVETRIGELAEQHTALSESVRTIREQIGMVEKRINAVENDTAVKKSSDLGGSQEVTTIKKSKWSGAFLGSVSDILK